MKISKRTRLKMLYLFVIAGIFSSFSAAGAVDDSAVPIHVEADRMVSNEGDNSVVFIGNVDAVQGNLIIRSDEMTVFYVEQKTGSGAKNSQIEKLICIGNVEISEGDWVGTGKRMDYFAGDRKVILTGDAKGWQGQNMVSGKTITYYLDEGRSVVEGPSIADGSSGGEKDTKTGRVKAVIHPESDSKK
ncbi:MAG: lipopolysaccharide transport periplasmic protein LptA [Desulfobulbaceae bacterium]|nr:lipopolysaccharide transport periplasmic protein LptA [Desulfobulbaceae bacterium]